LTRAPLTTLLLTMLLLLLPACRLKQRPPGQDAGAGGPGGKAPSKARSKDRDKVVATIGKDKITVGMLEDELNRQNPYVRMRFTEDARKREFLKNMIRFEVLAREARKRALQRDPEVVRRVKRVMIDRMMDQLRSALVSMEQITDRDVQAYYDAHRSQFHQPPKVRASQIVLKTRQEALAVYNRARQQQGDVKHFTALVKEHSIDKASREKRGDLGFFDRSTTRIPKPVVDAVFAIDALWRVGPPVQTEEGWVVLMKTGEMDAVNRPLELEKNRIKNRLYNQRRLKALEKFVDDLQARAKVQIVDKNLSKVKVDLDPKPLHLRPDHAH
jgi:parvulin-like peptidyl-prolyl isomerase